MLVANSWRNLRSVTETSRKSATQDVTVYKTAQQNASSSGPQSRPLSTRTSEFGSECVSQGRANDFLASAGIHSRAIHTPCPTSKGRIVCEVQDGAPTLMAAPPTYLSQLPGADSAYAQKFATEEPVRATKGGREVFFRVHARESPKVRRSRLELR